MTCNVSEMWSPKMPEGLDFEISYHPLTMKRVVNLIFAMERFKGGRSETVQGTGFRDEDLLNIMLENLVEGKHTDKTLLHDLVGLQIQCLAFSVTVNQSNRSTHTIFTYLLV